MSAAEGGKKGGSSGKGLQGLNDVRGWGLVVIWWLRCEWGDQFLRTVLHNIKLCLQNSFCESQTWRFVS